MEEIAVFEAKDGKLLNTNYLNIFSLMKYFFLFFLFITFINMANSQTPINFTFRAAYNWAETRDINNADIGLFIKSGTIAGSWSWNFENGEKGNTHFISSSSFRSIPYSLTGTIQFNMFELTGNSEDTLYMSYDGVSTDYNTGTTIIKAIIVGGAGKYKNASGEVTWTSINGFIEDGKGQLILP